MGTDRAGEDEISALRARVRELEGEVERAAWRLRAILEHVPAVLYVKDADGVYLAASRQGLEGFGLTPEVVVGKRDIDVFPPDLAQRFEASDQKILAGGEPTYESYALPMPWGSRHFTTMRFSIPDPEGRPAGVGGFAIDVTERVELQRKLERAHERLQTIVDKAPVLIAVKDADGRYELVNRRYEEVVGMPREQILGKRDVDVFPPETAARLRARDSAAMRSAEPVAEEESHPLSDGPHQFISVESPIPARDGAADGVCIVATDITERTRLERALADANRELARLATIDGLTGIANRRRFDDHLSAELLRSARTGSTLGLLLCDVDHFKRFNDRYGHTKGDDCLRLVAETVAEVAKRPADLAARYGGEEFAVILPDTTVEGVLAVAERLQLELAVRAIEHAENDGKGRVTLSIGAAHVVGGCEPQSLIGAADGALYSSKRRGRDRVEAVEVASEPVESKRSP